MMGSNCYFHYGTYIHNGKCLFPCWVYNGIKFTSWVRYWYLMELKFTSWVLVNTLLVFNGIKIHIMGFSKYIIGI